MPLKPYHADAPADPSAAIAPHAHVMRESLLETFERHVRIDSPSDRAATTLPPTEAQRTFAVVLADDLCAG